MKIPRGKNQILTFVKDLIEECMSSRPQRVSQNRKWKDYYFTGANDGRPADYNKTFAHIDRLGAYLFSAADTRFSIEFDATEAMAYLARADAASSFLSREYHRRSIDLAMADAVEWGLVKGACLLKHNWEHEGLSGYVVQPEMFGVLREDLSDLERQEAMVHTTFITPAQLRRRLAYHPDGVEIMRNIASFQKARDDDGGSNDNYFHQIVIGGTQPVSTGGSTNPTGGLVNVIGSPSPMLSQAVINSLIRVEELWVLDDAKEDYITFQLVWPNTLIAGALTQENMLGVKGEHPFTLVTPNKVDGYFWGRSEIANILMLQEMLNGRISDLQQIWRKQANPPQAFTGFTGMTEEIGAAFNVPGGYIAEDSPNGKVQDMSPKMPEGALAELSAILDWFDDMAGFAPVLQGKGEQGVRAQAHAATLTRNASPRMKDRALLIERQLAESGDLCFKILQAKDAKVYVSEAKEQFFLAQMPDDYRMTVDSHSSSPAFSEDAMDLIFQLVKAGSIDPISLLELTHPPMEDKLVARAKERAAAEAKRLAANPDLAKRSHHAQSA